MLSFSTIDIHVKQMPVLTRTLTKGHFDTWVCVFDRSSPIWRKKKTTWFSTHTLYKRRLYVRALLKPRLRQFAYTDMSPLSLLIVLGWFKNLVFKPQGLKCIQKISFSFHVSVTAIEKMVQNLYRIVFIISTGIFPTLQVSNTSIKWSNSKRVLTPSVLGL